MGLNFRFIAQGISSPVPISIFPRALCGHGSGFVCCATATAIRGTSSTRVAPKNGGLGKEFMAGYGRMERMESQWPGRKKRAQTTKQKPEKCRCWGNLSENHVFIMFTMFPFQACKWPDHFGSFWDPLSTEVAAKRYLPLVPPEFAHHVAGRELQFGSPSESPQSDNLDQSSLTTPRGLTWKPVSCSF